MRMRLALTNLRATLTCGAGQELEGMVHAALSSAAAGAAAAQHAAAAAARGGGADARRAEAAEQLRQVCGPRCSGM